MWLCAVFALRPSRRLDLLCEAEIDLLELHDSNERDAGRWKLETEVRETSSGRDFLAFVSLVICWLLEQIEAKRALQLYDDEANLLIKIIIVMAMLQSQRR